MAPRAAPTRHDPSAHEFLNAAAVLIDQAFDGSAERGRHPANLLHFPAALHWLRIEDVVRCARERGDGSASHKALRNRWPDKDSFLRDAVVHALLYRDDPARDPTPLASALGGLAASESPSDAIAQITDSLLGSLRRHPRSYLLLHLGPLIDQHNDLHRTIVKRIQTSREPWYKGYRALLKAWDLAFRPGWTVERFDMTLQAMLDGFLLRTKLQPDLENGGQWRGASLFADSVVTFTLGSLDSNRRGLTAGEALDISVRSVPRQSP
jgi:hypothetical protein